MSKQTNTENRFDPSIRIWKSQGFFDSSLEAIQIDALHPLRDAAEFQQIKLLNPSKPENTN